MYPVDTIKTRMQALSHPGQRVSTITAAAPLSTGVELRRLCLHGGNRIRGAQEQVNAATWTATGRVMPGRLPHAGSGMSRSGRAP
jgi:hypothetical protein